MKAFQKIILYIVSNVASLENVVDDKVKGIKNDLFF